MMSVAAAIAAGLVWHSASRSSQIFCGVGDGPVVPEVVRERWNAQDSMWLAQWRERLGRDPDVKNGAKVFKGKCGACHRPDQDMTGPALQGLLSRAPQPALEWYLAFMQRQDSLIKAGEPYTLALRERWGAPPWLHPNMLTREDLLDALVFVELYERRPVP